MKAILMTSSAVLLVSGLAAAQAQEAVCPEDIDAFTRDYEEAMAAFGEGETLSASEQAELFGLRTTAENLYRAGKLEMCAEAISRARLMLDTAVAPQAIQPGELVGMELRNAEDEYLGEVDDVTLDPASGRIAYVLVEHGGFLGIGDSLFPVPWRAVTWTPGADHLLLDLTEERLENAPRYLEDEVTATERRGWLMSVHTYYGVEPYWQDSLGTIAASGMTTGGAAGAGAEAPAVTATPAEGEAGPASAGEASAADQPTTEAPEPGTQAVTAPAEGEAEASEAEADAPEIRAAEGESNAPEGGTQAAVAVEQAPAAAAAGASAAAGEDRFSMLMERIEGLESQIQELSRQGLGEDVRQAIGELETRVQELAESGPGEEVRQAVAELREQVSALRQQQPGEEIRAAIGELEERVRSLAEQSPGDELRAAVSELETRLEELARTTGTGGLREMVGRTDSEDRGQSEGAGFSGGEAVEVQVNEPEQEAEVRVIQPGQQPSTAGQDAGLAAGTVTEPSLPAVSSAPGAGQGAAPSGGTAGETAAIGAGQAEPTGESSAATGGTLPIPAVPEAESDLGQPGGEQATLGGNGAPEPCETGITRLEEDLARAEERGISIDEARNELEAAQAMLRRASEALCRAAIKRARDELVAQGFQPTQAN